MKNNLLTLGTLLSKSEQQIIQGGTPYRCGPGVSPVACDRKCKAYAQERDCPKLLRECRVRIKNCKSNEDDLLL